MPRVTEISMWVRSTDMDADDIVNNARYFEYFEQARLEHLADLGLVQRPRTPDTPSRSFTIAETSCRFRAPLRHRDVIKVRCWTGEVRNRSFILLYDVLKPDGTVAAEGSSGQVWLDTEGNPTPLSDYAREALQESSQ